MTMKPINVGGYNIIIKPSLVMIIAAVLFGVSSVFILGSYPKAMNRTPAYGFLAPTSWKFEFRAPARASVSASSNYNTNGGVDTTKGGNHSQYRLDMESGVTVNIDAMGPSPDYIYLRDGLNLAQLRQQGTATLTFEGKASASHPVLFTIRDNGKLLWRQGVTLTDQWQNYRMTVPSDNIQEARKLFVVFSVQMGGQKGTVSLRKLYLK